ncbi:MAG: MFS transporter [Candidatus Lutacidiplasmatales archaeon]
MEKTTNPLRVLRHRNFQLLWVGSVVSSLGTAIGGVVLTWVVFTSYHSPIDVALLGIVGFLPSVVFGLLAGAVVDRVDRRLLMVGCDVARLLTLAGLAAYTLVFGINLVALLGAALIVATFSTVFRPATNAAIPRLVPETDFTDSNGLLMAGTTVAGFVGSPLGGILVITVGVVGGLLTNAVTFGFSGALISLMVIPALAAKEVESGGRRPSLLSEVQEGMRFLRYQKPLLWITLSGMVANFFLSLFFAFVVIYASIQLHQNAAGFGVLLAAGAAGWTIGAIVPGRIGTEKAPALWYAGVWTAAGVVIVAIGLVQDLPSASLLSLAFGILGGIGNTTFFAAVQRQVPPHLLGRFFATDEAGSFAMIPAGQVVGGLLILSIGIGPTYVFAGVGAFVCSGILLLIPSVRSWGRSAGH